MARPIKNNMDYFPHDNKMRNDRKIKALRAKFGLQGYAVFNMLLELLCESELLVIQWNDMERELISGDFGLPSELLDEILNYLIHIELIQQSNGWLYCDNLDKRSVDIFEKRTRHLDSLRKENGVNITETRVSVAETHENGVNVTESTQSKVKESILKESISLGENWKTNFEIYIAELRQARNEALQDPEWIKKQQLYNPRVNIPLSIDKACVNFWATEAGWKHKKGKKTVKIDWRSTFANAIALKSNKVYDEAPQPQKQYQEL